MSGYIKLMAAPTMVIRMPTCSACHVDLDADADGLTCPCCGTMWSHRDGEGEPGQLYEEWSGEDIDGEAVDNEEAWRAGTAHEKAELDAITARIKAREEKEKFLADAMNDPEGRRLADAAVALAGDRK